MEGLLKEKTRIVSQAGIDYVVNKLIGSGGQGEVYEVEANGKKYALKWYFKNMATDTQEQILKNLVSQGAPDETFLWPLDFVPRNERGSFGYIMNLRPKEYKGINDLLTRRAEPTFYTLCKVCLNLTKGYQRLHSKGYSYRDISNGNVFFNPNDGNVLICDNDNVSVNGKDDSSVYGTPKYMAPELVLHKDKPSTKTDLFSLSVLIFYMLMIAHPLDGKREASIKCFDPFAMEELYGKNPLFIFDPDDRSNAPLPGYHDNALVFWELYPEFLRHLFTRSFTEGLKSPGKRLVEKEWMDASIKLMNSIVYCECGAEVFYDESLEDAGKAHICWCCGKKVNMPSRIKISKHKIMLNKTGKLFSHHINDGYNMDLVVGSVVQNPKNPDLWGIKNESDENWVYIRADGTQISLPKGKSAAIIKGAKINFGAVTGEFE